MKIQQIYILYDFLSLSGLIPNISKLKKEEKKKRKENKSALKQEKTKEKKKRYDSKYCSLMESSL